MANNIIQIEEEGLNSDRLLSVALGRAAIYEYLSYVLQEPVKEEFIGLSERFIPAFQEIASASKDKKFMEGVDILSHYISVEKRLPKNEVLLKLNMQWTAIFLTGASGFPYSASVALTKSRTELEAPWEKVVEFYSKCGFVKPDGYNEAEDHISMELFCLFYLASKEADAIKNGDNEVVFKMQRLELNFIKEYLDIWIGSACDKLYEYCLKSDFELPLYKAISLLVKAYLAYDECFLQNLLSDAISL